MRFFFIIFSLFFISNCGESKDKVKPNPVIGIDELKTEYENKLSESREYRNQETGWIESDCDGILWSGKYASVLCKEVDIEAAEAESGRFDRRPQGECRTTWSRDMAIAGLFPYALRCGRLDIIEKHIKYGEKNYWKMGFPLDDGRVLYSPQLISLLYSLRFHLGGDDNQSRKIPAVWPSGLKDYEAHLQVMSIWLRSHWESISQTMYERLKEHLANEPNSALYNYMVGRYSGEQQPTIKILLDKSMPIGGYVRCDDGHGCVLSEWLFVASLLLEDLQ